MNAFLQRISIVWKIVLLSSPFITLPLFLYLIVQIGKEPKFIPSKLTDILFFGVAPLIAFEIFYVATFAFFKDNRHKITTHLTAFLISVILESVCIYTSIITLVILSPVAASL